MTVEKVVVLGSNSFSGAHFVDHCLREGLEVTGISRSPEPDDLFLPYRNNPNAKSFRFFRYDLNRDLDDVFNVIADATPDYIVNFAAQGMVAQSWNAPAEWLMTNTVSPVILHDRLRKCDFIKSFLQVSTPEVYGDREGVIAESYHYEPSTPYAVSKAAVDMSLMAFQRTYGFPVVFTRAANVYGPGQQLYRIIPLTILKIMLGEKLQLHGGGTSRRSFIHIRDVARGTLLALRKGKPGDVFHLATPELVSIRVLVKEICRLMDADFDTLVEVAEERPGKDGAYILDCAHARDALGWSAEVDLEEGLHETIEWVSSNIDKLRDFPREYIHKA
ncbi:MAG: GDP-mannose 4,6-dehydratase [Planctomycetes bacterium]|nr:GDP-mannose 4,6-dehydratase [Planctomycetota bacterium]